MAEQSTTSESASTLDSDINELLGDFSSVEESPESDAGTTPVAETATTEVGAEGTTKEVRAETPSADAPKTEPDKAVIAETPTDTDPLNDAKPFTYSFNGEDKSIEGIKVLGESGAIVTPEGLAILAERLADGERFHSTTRQQYEQIQGYEKLSAFHTKDDKGQDVTLNGTEGLLAARMQLVTLGAAYQTATEALRDPQVLASLLAQNEKGELVLNEQGWKNLVLKSDNAEMKADQTARQYFGNVVKTQPKAESTQVDFAKEAPQAITGAAQAAKVDAKLLTDADRKFLEAQFPRYVRPATKADIDWNPKLKVGQPIIDASFTQVVKDRVELRSEVVRTAKATQSAADENTKRLAAAAIGTRTAVKPAVEKPKDTSRADDAATAWAAHERSLAAAL